MKDSITIGSKLGYLNERNGKYNYVEVVDIKAGAFVMNSVYRTGKNSPLYSNIYNEDISNVIDLLKTESVNINGKMLLKHKGTRSLVQTVAQEKYTQSLCTTK